MREPSFSARFLAAVTMNDQRYLARERHDHRVVAAMVALSLAILAGIAWALSLQAPPAPWNFGDASAQESGT